MPTTKERTTKKTTRKKKAPLHHQPVAADLCHGDQTRKEGSNENER